jgi:Xaa-Pro aminopeptidase
MAAVPPHTQPGRVERIRAGLVAAGCTGAVLVGESHAAHLCGYSRYLSGLVAVVLDGDGRRTLVVPAFEAAAAESVGHADAVAPYGPDHFLDFSPLPSLARACAQILPAGRVGVAAGSAAITEAVGMAAGSGTLDLAPLVDEVRRTKDLDELERLADAYALTLVGQDAIVAAAHTGVSEIELFSAAQVAAQNASGNPVEYISALCTGRSTTDVAPPVHVPGCRALEDGDPILADVAVRHRGYWGDTTRTTVAGTNPEAQSVIDGITEILRASAARLLPGTPVAEFYAFMQERILKQFPTGIFPHHGGHCLGVGVGEDPQIIPSEDSVIEAGMVFAVEPGVYFKGRFGVRVEDVFVVSDQGGRLISDFAASR